jgi:hypothetical protein
MFLFGSRSSRRAQEALDRQRQRAVDRKAVADSTLDSVTPEASAAPAALEGGQRASWIDSTLDLKQGLDVVEMTELPEEFFGKPHA